MGFWLLWGPGMGNLPPASMWDGDEGVFMVGDPILSCFSYFRDTSGCLEKQDIEIKPGSTFLKCKCLAISYGYWPWPDLCLAASHGSFCWNPEQQASSCLVWEGCLLARVDVALEVAGIRLFYGK